MSSQLKAKFYDTPSFKALNEKWQQKLSDKGFKDIETPNEKLRLWHSEYFANKKRFDPEVVEARQNYYRIAGQFLNEHPFKCAFDRKVWTMHADGMGIREIAAKIKRPGLKDKIHTALKRLEIEMINKAKGKT